jgi:hypothetical protein
VLETRVVFTGPAGTVDVLEWDGESHPHAARVVGSEAFAQGALVSATATVTVLGPEIRYRARSDGSCKLPEYETEPPVRFGAGDDVFCFAADEGNLDCESGDVDWLVAHDGWLEPDPQDDAEHRSARECLAALLESVPLDAAADVYTGWWIRLDDGWVHADDRFTLEIKCDECEGEHDRCVEGCTDAACTKQCDEALADCEPPWRRHPPG